MTDRNLRCCVYGFSLAVIAYGLVLSRLTGGDDFLNSYPFVTADGFDWFFEGYVLYERLLGHCAPSLPILRDPGFVLVCALDAALRASGLIVIFAHTLSFFATGVVLLEAARFYRITLAIAASITVIMLIDPLNYVRLFVLADPLAVGFLTISAYAMLHHLRTGSVSSLTVSGVLALLGGMTQTYAAIPFIIGAAVSGIAHAHSRRGLLQVGVAFVAFAVSLVALKLAWRAAIPHGDQPSQFQTLKLSFGMARFYVHVWTIVYVPLLPLAATAFLSWYRSGRRFLAEVLFLGTTVLVFALFTFLYQWAEARFTFIYQPVVLLLLMAFASREAAAGAPGVSRQSHVPSVAAVCSAVLVVVSLALTPMKYYGEPLLAWRPLGSWVFHAWLAPAVDRFGLGAPGSANIYSHATVPTMMGPYARQIVSSYLTFRAKRADLSGPTQSNAIIGAAGTLSDCK